MNKNIKRVCLIFFLLIALAIIGFWAMFLFGNNW